MWLRKGTEHLNQPWWWVHIPSYSVPIAFQLPKTILNIARSHVKLWCTSETLCMEQRYCGAPWWRAPLYNKPLQHRESISIHLRIPQTQTQTSLLLDLHWYFLIHKTPTSNIRNWKEYSDTECPCTRMVRSPQKIQQILLIWWYFTLSFAMSVIVEIVYSSPAKNTHSQKQNHQQLPQEQNFDGRTILDTRKFFFTLPNMMDDDMWYSRTHVCSIFKI